MADHNHIGSTHKTREQEILNFGDDELISHYESCKRDLKNPTPLIDVYEVGIYETQLLKEIQKRGLKL